MGGRHTHAKGDGGCNDLDLAVRPVILRALALIHRQAGVVVPAPLWGEQHACHDVSMSV